MKFKILQYSFQILRMTKMISIYLLLIFQALHLFAQNIGINQPNPVWPLDIIGSHGVIRLSTTTSNFGSTLELKNNNASAEYLGVINFNNAVNSYPGQISYRSGHDLVFNTFFQEQMRIDINGNVGFGVQAPQFPLDVNAPQGVNRLVSTANADGSVLVLQNDTPSPNILGSINFNSAGGGTPGQIAYTANHELEIRVNNQPRFVFKDPGKCGISRDPVTNTLEVGGSASKTIPGEWLGNSDARLKKNIKQLNSQVMLNKLLALEGVSFEWNDDKTGSARPEGIQFGFIAQNIQKAFPTLVEADNLGYLQTAYGTYDPMMVEAIRALNDKIKSLENENEELKSSIEEIKRWIAAKNQYYEKSE